MSALVTYGRLNARSMVTLQGACKSFLNSVMERGVTILLCHEIVILSSEHCRRNHCRGRDIPIVNVDVFFLHVKVSPCHSLFETSQNIATSHEGSGPESEFPWKWWAWENNGSTNISSNSNNFYPLRKTKFSMPPSPGGFLLSTLAPK